MPEQDAPTIDAILAKYADARSRIVELQTQLSTAETAVSDGFVAAGRKRPNASDLAKLKTIYAQQDKLDAAYDKMAWDELVVLDKSDAVKALAQNFKSLKNDLDTTLDNLKKTREFADAAAQVAELFSQIGQSLLTLGLI